MWWKKHKWKVILPVALVVILVFAFWYGGNDPVSRGWTVEQPGMQSTAPDSMPSSETENISTPELDDTPNSTVTPEPGDTLDPTTPSEPAKAVEPSQNITVEPTEEPTAGTTEDPTPSSPPEPTMEIDPATEEDQHQTEPVPEGKPAPVEPQDTEITETTNPTETSYACTISISCATILNNMDSCDPEKVELVPSDGWILRPVTVTFNEGESVFDVLQSVCKQQRIHLEFSNTPIYNSAYIEGIYNLYEFDVGNLSGWMYKVNGWFPNYGCSRYQLSDGDVIEWVYTCDLGSDVGGSNAIGG